MIYIISGRNEKSCSVEGSLTD